MQHARISDSSPLFSVSTRQELQISLAELLGRLSALNRRVA